MTDARVLGGVGHEFACYRRSLSSTARGFSVGCCVVSARRDGVERGDLIAAYDGDVESLVDGFAAVGFYFEPGVVARRDHVLVMNIAGRKAVEEREPCPGATEEPLATLLSGAPGVLDELGPAVAITRNGPGSAEFNGCIAIKPLDKRLPRDIKAQIAGVVHNA